MSSTPSSSFLANETPSTPPPRRHSQDFYSSLYNTLVSLTEDDEEYYTAEEDEASSDSEESDYMSFEEIFGGVGSLCSEEDEADDVEFERRQAEFDSRYSFDEDRADVDPEFEDPFGGYSQNAQSPEPPSAVVGRSFPSAGFSPHWCNCIYCPSRTTGFISSSTSRSVNATEILPDQSADRASRLIPPLILTPSLQNPGNTRALRSDPSRPLGDLNGRSEGGHSHENTIIPPSDRHDLPQTAFTLPSIRMIDIWYDDLPASPSRVTSEVPTPPSRMALSFILNGSLAPSVNQPSLISPIRILPDEHEDLETGDDLPWLSTLAPVFDVSFIPDCSNDLTSYSLSLTRNVRTTHPSRDPNNRFANMDFPGPLELRD